MLRTLACRATGVRWCSFPTLEEFKKSAAGKQVLQRFRVTDFGPLRAEEEVLYQYSLQKRRFLSEFERKVKKEKERQD